ncbi:MAG TPA: hypothetical protein VIS06_11845, partial [Mycobacteriales bacterium]
VAVTGSVTATPKVGDPVKLDGFTVTADATVPALAVGIDHVSGAFTSFPVNATAGDGTDAGSADPGADNSLPIDVNVAAGGVLHLTTPDAALTLTGFTANAPGSMSFDAGTIAAHLTLTGPDKDTQEPVTIDTVSVTCTGGGQVATVDVPEPAQTTTSAPPTTGTQGGDDDHNGDDDKTASHPATTASVTTATTTSASVVRNVSARGTLANTGTPYTLPMTGTGAALVLLGAGLLVASRRRHVLPEGMTEQD